MEDSLQLQLLTKYSSLYWAELVICKWLDLSYCESIHSKRATSAERSYAIHKKSCRDHTTHIMEL